MVGELPEGVGDRGPEHHLRQRVVLWGRGLRGLDVVDGREARRLEVEREEVDEAVQGDAGHNVDEEAGTMLVRCRV